MTAALLAELQAAPLRLAELSNGVTVERLHATPAADTWSARDVLVHLRSCADVWGPVMARILAEDRPAIRAVSPRTHVHGTGYVTELFLPSLKAFSRQREELLALLSPLSPEQWARTALVTGAGRPLEKTVLSYVERMVRHERSHLRQVAQLLS